MRILQHCYRVYVAPPEFDALIGYYEGLQGIRCERRIFIPETNIEAAKIGAFLILSGEPEQLDTVRGVSAIFYVDSLDEMNGWLRANGAEILHDVRRIAAGRNLTARHPDGLVVEYFETATKEIT